ncbi:MAG: signal recognition particle-docking protein FtsY [Rickettsiales bacterium]|nr:signal recognition particle-docking protein FtsY [Rickettsiales bacterium]
MSWFKKLTSGLSKTSTQISTGISDIFTKRRLDDAMLEELEELLIATDMGAATAASIVAEFGQGRFDKEVDPGEVRQALAAQIAARLQPVALPLEPIASPFVILVVGVNGNGKTTTIGKLAAQFQAQGKSVTLVACDTFRAAAVEQLQVWAERNGCDIITGAPEADPASVAYQAMEQAKSDVILIDTAGRLHNKANLMEELSKIVRVMQKVTPDAPHAVLQVLDATTGQNAVAQVEAFKTLVNVSGLVITKLDGTAKAGIVVALADKFKLPVHAIGVGEGIDDLQAFEAEQFAEALVGNS